jgi:hypothetical protein
VRTEQVWYSANSWKKPIWYSLTRSVEFDEVIAAMEKVNVGEYVFAPDVGVPGLDNFKSQARDIIKSLET